MKKRLRGLLALLLAFVTFFAGMPVETQAADEKISKVFVHNNEGSIAVDSYNSLENFNIYEDVAMGTQVQGSFEPYKSWTAAEKDNIGGWKLWKVSSENGTSINVASGIVNLYGQDAVISENAWSDVGNPNMAAVSAVML